MRRPLRETKPRPVGETVHVGRDGWLFLVGGTNAVLRQYRPTIAGWWRLRRWARLIAARTRRAERLGIRCLHVFVPEKLSIYEDRTDGLAFDPANGPARRLARRLAGYSGFVDLVAPLRAVRDGPVPLYRRTDSHWTNDGCLIGYRALLRACGAVAPPDIADRARFETDGVWDLGAKLPDRPREAITSWMLARDAVRVRASDLVESYEAEGRSSDLHVGAHVVYRNEGPRADPRTLVLFGDSYAHFAPIMLTGLLAETFREVHFVWSSSLDWGYVERIRPDILVFEMAERFLRRVPDDRFDLSRYASADLPAAARRATAAPVV